MSQIEKDLGTLKPDFDSFPDLSNKAESTNNILSTLTNDRYSNFEITKDLTLKVHSNEVGGFKEWKIKCIKPATYVISTPSLSE